MILGQLRIGESPPSSDTLFVKYVIVSDTIQNGTVNLCLLS